MEILFCANHLKQKKWVLLISKLYKQCLRVGLSLWNKAKLESQWFKELFPLESANTEHYLLVINYTVQRLLMRVNFTSLCMELILLLWGGSTKTNTRNRTGNFFNRVRSLLQHGLRLGFLQKHWDLLLLLRSIFLNILSNVSIVIVTWSLPSVVEWWCVAHHFTTTIGLGRVTIISTWQWDIRHVFVQNDGLLIVNKLATSIIETIMVLSLAI